MALTPLLVAISASRTVSVSRAFLMGLLCGVVYFTGTLYWITHVMVTYGDLSWPAALGVNALLIVYLALFPAVFALIVRRMVVVQGLIGLALAPLVWVATELGRTYLLTGFPWVLLGYSQATVLPVAQLASVTGVYGISMLVCAVSAALAATFSRAPFQPQSRSRLATVNGYTPLALVVLAVFAVAVWGSARAATAPLTREGDPVRVGIVQGNVDQAQKWDEASAASIFRDYIDLTRQVIRGGANLVLWPESSTPFMFDEDPAGAQQVRTIARQAHVSVLFGSDQVEWRLEGNRRIVGKLFNSAFLVRQDGSTAGTYHKMHLVPFGEYVPFQRLLFFAAPLTRQTGTFDPGTTPTLLRDDSHPLSVAICYEVIYPELVREFVGEGSELLTTITNDAWFGTTSAPYQHFEQASMRAIEEGRFLVRAANTGISGIVDPYGRVLARTELLRPAALVGEARFLRASTFYGRHGDWLAYSAAAVTLITFVLGWTPGARVGAERGAGVPASEPRGGAWGA